jgi:hypothetical protein
MPDLLRRGDYCGAQYITAPRDAPAPLRGPYFEPPPIEEHFNTLRYDGR